VPARERFRSWLHRLVRSVNKARELRIITQLYAVGGRFLIEELVSQQLKTRRAGRLCDLCELPGEEIVANVFEDNAEDARLQVGGRRIGVS
jgi:hypothetical protein